MSQKILIQCENRYFLRNKFVICVLTKLDVDNKIHDDDTCSAHRVRRATEHRLSTIVNKTLTCRIDFQNIIILRVDDTIDGFFQSFGKFNIYTNATMTN